jgi:hypothetical protein
VRCAKHQGDVAWYVEGLWYLSLLYNGHGILSLLPLNNSLSILASLKEDIFGYFIVNNPFTTITLGKKSAKSAPV